MAPATDPERYQVLVRIRATSGSGPLDAAVVVAVLTSAAPAEWAGVVVSPSRDGRSMDLRIGTTASDPTSATRSVVDAVRGLLGLDAACTSWVVDGREAWATVSPD